MKIKNNVVSLKIGEKQYDFNNLIFDEYLEKFVASQLTENRIILRPEVLLLSHCLLKFDTPFSNLSSSSQLNEEDFSIRLGNMTYTQTINESQVSILYNYYTNDIYDFEKQIGGYHTKIQNYYGRKITAIGFVTGYYDSKVCAILDTSNYNIYLQENQELSITRRDIITTDTLFYSNDLVKIPGPAHLAPGGVPQLIKSNIYHSEGNQPYYFNIVDNGYGILYSVGLSSYIDYIDKEFVIGEDIQVEQNGNELNIKDIENYLSLDNSLYCSNELFCSSNLYPAKTNYKYVILKYKVWQMVRYGTSDAVGEELTDTGYYYHQAIPINKFGKNNLIIKYERG